MHVTLQKLWSAYSAALGSALARAWLVGLGLALVAAGYLARVGTWPWRLSAFAALACVAGGWALHWVRQRNTPRKAETIIERVLVPARPEAGARVARALRLANDVGQRNTGESPVLAQLFYERALDEFGSQPVTELGQRRAHRLRWVTVGGLALIGAALALGSRQVVEGLDVLGAVNGVAPVPMTWLSEVEIISQPPAYLGERPTRLVLDSAALLPEGSELLVRGRPVAAGRNLVLTDGKTEVGFADDGSGAVVAHWPLVGFARLQIAVRFGDVLVLEPSALEVEAQPDAVPIVHLADAPRELDLTTLERLELRWTATDDHALSEVALVLRSGGREERRPLEHFPADQQSGAGGHVLYPSDPFLQRVFLPVIVRVEARDNDARLGSKWGVSEAFTLRPSVPGSPEAERFAALTGLRDALVRYFAEQFLSEPTQAVAPRVPPERQRRTRLSALSALEREAAQRLSGNYGGLEVPKGWAPFVRGQFQRLRRAIESGKDERSTLEGVVLGVDSALQNLGNRDAGEVAKRLGDVAEEAAFGAHLAQQSEHDREVGQERLRLAVSVLDAGGKQLTRLAALGRDLGSVTEADLGRVRRAQETGDFFHAELAALHLAARLHRPNPSFGAKGGGGVESGSGQGGQGGEDGSDPASDADAEFDRLAQELEQLSQEHADGLERSAGALDDAERSLNDDGTSAEAKRRAELLRRQVVGLPQPGEDPGTSEASAALAREHTGAMAHELERMAFEGALESGVRARGAAEEALRRGDLPDFVQDQLRSTLRELESQLQWAAEQQKARKVATEQAARAALEQLSRQERELALRARRLSSDEASSSGKPTSAGLPDEVKTRLRNASRLMDEAARALESGSGEQGVELQRQAQRLLEESETGKTESGDEGSPQQQSGSRRSAPSIGGGDVPAADRRNAAEDFRKRVLNGLGQRGSGSLSGAVKRYAEGLLR